MIGDRTALTLSILSLVVAAISLGWNIYRDVVVHLKLKVSFGIKTIIHDSMPDRPRYLEISAINMGATPVTLSMICIKNAPLWRRVLRKTESAVVMFDYTNPLSARLPKRLELGDSANLFLTFDRECFLKSPCTHVGVTDFYGNAHWVPKAHVKQAMAYYIKEFRTDGVA